MACALLAVPALAQKRYDPGASDTDVKIGSIMPYSGTFSEYGDGAKFVELAHQLVEQDQVLLLVGTWGARTNAAIRAYMNENKVPQFDGKDWARFGDLIAD